MTDLEDFAAYVTARGVTRTGERSFEAGDSLYLYGLTTLPEGVTLSAGRSIYLSSPTTLPEGVTLSAGDWLDLYSLTTLSEGVTLSAGGWLDLYSLTTLPEGVTLSAGGWLDLHNLTTLPEGVTLSAGDSLDLHNLTSETQRYQGRTIRLRTIDGICTRLIRSRKAGDGVTLWSAQYFRGRLDTDKRCYVAEQGEYSAHGDTPEKALRDLRFKIASTDFDCDELVETIRKRGTISFNDYRLLTGACESGLTEGLRALGRPDVEELPLADALAICKGQFGGERLTRLFAEAGR